MPCSTTVDTIYKTEYIGNSLDKINGNFSGLVTGVCDNATEISNLLAAMGQLTTTVSVLSAKIPGIAKAWVCFDGTKNTSGSPITDGQDCLIQSSYNVSSVVRRNNGYGYNTTSGQPTYKVIFSEPMLDGNYSVSGISNKTTGQGSTTITLMDFYPELVEPGKTAEHFIVAVHYGGANTILEASRINLQVFGN